jgi:hypothetical protein
MHVKPLEGRVETLRDFVRNYAMFVASILTALALEQAGLAWHDHRAARIATQEIEQELKANLADVREAIRSNDARAPALDALTRDLSKAIRDGRPKAEVVASIVQPQARRFSVGFSFPTLQREAWERAVVNQSAAHIEAARLGKFSIAYAAQRDIGQLAFQGMTMLLSGTRMIDAINDADLGQVEPIEYLRVMRQYGAALGAVQSNLRDVEAQLQAALGEPAVSAARPPAAPSRTSPASR